MGSHDEASSKEKFLAEFKLKVVFKKLKIYL